MSGKEISAEGTDNGSALNGILTGKRLLAILLAAAVVFSACAILLSQDESNAEQLPNPDQIITYHYDKIDSGADPVSIMYWGIPSTEYNPQVWEGTVEEDYIDSDSEGDVVNWNGPNRELSFASSNVPLTVNVTGLIKVSFTVDNGVGKLSVFIGNDENPATVTNLSNSSVSALELNLGGTGAKDIVVEGHTSPNSLIPITYVNGQTKVNFKLNFTVSGSVMTLNLMKAQSEASIKIGEDEKIDINFSYTQNVFSTCSGNVDMVFGGWETIYGDIINPGDVVSDAITDLYAHWIYPDVTLTTAQGSITKEGNNYNLGIGTIFTNSYKIITSFPRPTDVPTDVYEYNDNGNNYVKKGSNSSNGMYKTIYLINPAQENYIYSPNYNIAAGTYRSVNWDSAVNKNTDLKLIVINGNSLTCGGDVVFDNIIIKMNRQASTRLIEKADNSFNANYHHLIMGTDIYSKSNGSTALLYAPFVLGGSATPEQTALESNKYMVFNEEADLERNVSVGTTIDGNWKVWGEGESGSYTVSEGNVHNKFILLIDSEAQKSLADYVIVTIDGSGNVSIRNGALEGTEIPGNWMVWGEGESGPYTVTNPDGNIYKKFVILVDEDCCAELGDFNIVKITNCLKVDLGTYIIIHSGVYSHLVAGTVKQTLGTVGAPLSTYIVIKKATVMGIVAGTAGTSSVQGRGDTDTESYLQGGTFIYAYGLTTTGDTYEDLASGFERPTYVNDGQTYSWVTDENSVIQGGPQTTGKVLGSSHVFITGVSSVFDVQGGGRDPSASVENTYLEISGNAEVRHIACGTNTDGNRGADVQPVKKVNIVVQGKPVIATLLGAGYDTWWDNDKSNMKQGTIDIKIEGGNIGFVYGGGMRSTIGTATTKVNINITMTGGTIDYDLYGGGKGGVDKIHHWGTNVIDHGSYSITGDWRIWAKDSPKEINATNGTLHNSFVVVVDNNWINNSLEELTVITIDSGGNPNKATVVDGKVAKPESEDESEYWKVWGIDGTVGDYTVTNGDKYPSADGNKFIVLVDSAYSGLQDNTIIWIDSQGNITKETGIEFRDTIQPIGSAGRVDSSKYIGNNNTTGYAKVYGDITINLLGGTINGNVYGGGESAPAITSYMGFDEYQESKTTKAHFKTAVSDVSSVFGTITINLAGTDILNSVFGAGKGLMTSSTIGDPDEDSATMVTVDIHDNLYTKLSEQDAECGGITYAQKLKNGLSEVGNKMSSYSTIFIHTSQGYRYIPWMLPYSDSEDGSNINCTVEYSKSSENLKYAELVGTTEVNMTDGNIGSIYGGGSMSLVKSASAGFLTDVTVSGGIVNQNVFAGGLGEINRESVYGLAIITVDGGNVKGSVYGGSEKGAMKYDTYVKVCGVASVTGNVFGGGLGTVDNVSNYGHRTVYITDAATVKGSVYGGSQIGVDGKILGEIDYEHITNDVISALHKARSTIVIEKGIVEGAVFGGGLMGKTYGNTEVYIGYYLPTITGSPISNEYRTTTGTEITLKSIFAGGNVSTEGGDETTVANPYTDTLVQGYGTVKIRGNSAGAISINGSIMGSGNACLTGGDTEVEIVDVYNANPMTAIHRVDKLTIDNCNLKINGRDSITPVFGQDKIVSVFNIGEFILKNSASIAIEAPIDDIGLLKSCGSSGRLTNETAPQNRIVYMAGSTVYIRSADANDNPEYNEVKGYIMMVSTQGNYGAYAIGLVSGEGGFSVSGDTSIRAADTSISNGICCWYIAGIEKKVITMNLQSKGDRILTSTESYVTITKFQEDTDLIYAGGSFTKMSNDPNGESYKFVRPGSDLMEDYPEYLGLAIAYKGDSGGGITAYDPTYRLMAIGNSGLISQQGTFFYKDNIESDISGDARNRSLVSVPMQYSSGSATNGEFRINLSLMAAPLDGTSYAGYLTLNFQEIKQVSYAAVGDEGAVEDTPRFLIANNIEVRVDVYIYGSDKVADQDTFSVDMKTTTDSDDKREGTAYTLIPQTYTMAELYLKDVEIIGAGSREMPVVYVTGDYILPECDYIPPQGKTFESWSVTIEGVTTQHKPGDTITVTKPVIIEPKWSKMAEVVFYGDGGTGSMTTESIKCGTDYRLPNCSYGAPSEDEVFAEWSVIIGSNKEVKRNPGDIITITGDTYIKAIWGDNKTVSFYSGGGSGSMSIESIALNERYELPDCRFTNAGKMFLNWSVSVNGGAAVVKYPGETVKATGNIEVTANWSTSTSYNVSFHTNESYGIVKTDTVASGSKYQLPIYNFGEPEDKKFYAWVVVINGGDENHYDEGEYVTITANTDVWPIWADKLTISFDKGTQGTEPYMRSEYCAFGKEYLIPECGFGVNVDYTFSCWKSGNTYYYPGQVVTLNANLALTAEWVLESSLYKRVVFDRCGGSGYMNMLKLDSTTESYKLPNCGYEAPSGKVFAGWNDNGDILQPGAIVDLTSTDRVIKANWVDESENDRTVRVYEYGATKPVYTFIVQNGGVYLRYDRTPQTIIQDEDIRLTNSGNQITYDNGVIMEGKVRVMAQSNSDGTTGWSNVGGEVIWDIGAGHIEDQGDGYIGTLLGSYIGNIEFKVTGLKFTDIDGDTFPPIIDLVFDRGGAEAHTYLNIKERQYYSVIFIDHGIETVRKYLENTPLTREQCETPSGNNFNGWYLDSAYTNIYDYNTVVSDDTDGMTLYARYTYVVTLDNMNGTTFTLHVSQTDKGALLSETDLPTPIYTGYIFMGWYKDADLVYKWGYQSDRVTEDTTLYAKWIGQDVRIYFWYYDKDDGGKLKLFSGDETGISPDAEGTNAGKYDFSQAYALSKERGIYTTIRYGSTFDLKDGYNGNGESILEYAQEKLKDKFDGSFVKWTTASPNDPYQRVNVYDDTIMGNKVLKYVTEDMVKKYSSMWDYYIYNDGGYPRYWGGTDEPPQTMEIHLLAETTNIAINVKMGLTAEDEKYSSTVTIDDPESFLVYPNGPNPLNPYLIDGVQQYYDEAKTSKIVFGQYGEQYHEGLKIGDEVIYYWNEDETVRYYYQEDDKCWMCIDEDDIKDASKASEHTYSSKVYRKTDSLRTTTVDDFGNFKDSSKWVKSYAYIMELNLSTGKYEEKQYIVEWANDYSDKIAKRYPLTYHNGYPLCGTEQIAGVNGVPDTGYYLKDYPIDELYKFIILVDSDVTDLNNINVIVVDQNGNATLTKNVSNNSGTSYSGYRLWGQGVVKNNYKALTVDAIFKVESGPKFLVLVDDRFSISMTNVNVVTIESDDKATLYAGVPNYTTFESGNESTWKVWGTNPGVETYTVTENRYLVTTSTSYNQGPLDTFRVQDLVLGDYYEFIYKLNNAVRSGYTLQGWHNDYVNISNSLDPSADSVRTLHITTDSDGFVQTAKLITMDDAGNSIEVPLLVGDYVIDPKDADADGIIIIQNGTETVSDYHIKFNDGSQSAEMYKDGSSVALIAETEPVEPAGEYTFLGWQVKDRYIQPNEYTVSDYYADADGVIVIKQVDNAVEPFTTFTVKFLNIDGSLVKALTGKIAEDTIDLTEAQGLNASPGTEWWVKSRCIEADSYTVKSSDANVNGEIIIKLYSSGASKNTTFKINLDGQLLSRTYTAGQILSLDEPASGKYWGIGNIDHVGYTITASDSDANGLILLRERWSQTIEYTITFASTRGGVIPQIEHVKVGDTIPLEHLTDENHEFLGWKSKSGAFESSVYVVNADDARTDHTIMLAGLWDDTIVTNTFYIGYVTEHGTLNKDGDTASLDQTVDLPSLSDAGYELIGWEVVTGNSRIISTSTYTIKASDADSEQSIVLKAIWSKKYVVKLDGETQTQTIAGQVVNLPYSIEKPSFIVSNNIITKGKSLSASDPLTMMYRANWKQIDYTVHVSQPGNGIIDLYLENPDNPGVNEYMDSEYVNNTYFHYGDKIKLSYTPKSSKVAFVKWEVNGQYYISGLNSSEATLIVQGGCTISVTESTASVVDIFIAFDDGNLNEADRNFTRVYMHDKVTGDYYEANYIPNYAGMEHYNVKVPYGDDYEVCIRYGWAADGTKLTTFETEYDEYALTGNVSVTVGGMTGLTYDVISARFVEKIHAVDGVSEIKDYRDTEYGQLSNATFDTGVSSGTDIEGSWYVWGDTSRSSTNYEVIDSDKVVKGSYKFILLVDQSSLSSLSGFTVVRVDSSGKASYGTGLTTSDVVKGNWKVWGTTGSGNYNVSDNDDEPIGGNKYIVLVDAGYVSSLSTGEYTVLTITDSQKYDFLFNNKGEINSNSTESSLQSGYSFVKDTKDSGIPIRVVDSTGKVVAKVTKYQGILRTELADIAEHNNNINKPNGGTPPVILMFEPNLTYTTYEGFPWVAGGVNVFAIETDINLAINANSVQAPLKTFYLNWVRTDSPADIILQLSAATTPSKYATGDLAQEKEESDAYNGFVVTVKSGTTISEGITVIKVTGTGAGGVEVVPNATGTIPGSWKLWNGTAYGDGYPVSASDSHKGFIVLVSSSVTTLSKTTILEITSDSAGDVRTGKDPGYETNRAYSWKLWNEGTAARYMLDYELLQKDIIYNLEASLSYPVEPRDGFVAECVGTDDLENHVSITPDNEMVFDITPGEDNNGYVTIYFHRDYAWYALNDTTFGQDARGNKYNNITYDVSNTGSQEWGHYIELPSKFYYKDGEEQTHEATVIRWRVITPSGDGGYINDKVDNYFPYKVTMADAISTDDFTFYAGTYSGDKGYDKTIYTDSSCTEQYKIYYVKLKVNGCTVYDLEDNELAFKLYTKPTGVVDSEYKEGSVLIGNKVYRDNRLLFIPLMTTETKTLTFVTHYQNFEDGNQRESYEVTVGGTLSDYMTLVENADLVTNFKEKYTGDTSLDYVFSDFYCDGVSYEDMLDTVVNSDLIFVAKWDPNGVNKKTFTYSLKGDKASVSALRDASNEPLVENAGNRLMKDTEVTIYIQPNSGYTLDYKETRGEMGYSLLESAILLDVTAPSAPTGLSNGKVFQSWRMWGTGNPLNAGSTVVEYDEEAVNGLIVYTADLGTQQTKPYTIVTVNGGTTAQYVGANERIHLSGTWYLWNTNNPITDDDYYVNDSDVVNGFIVLVHESRYDETKTGYHSIFATEEGTISSGAINKLQPYYEDKYGSIFYRTNWDTLYRFDQSTHSWKVYLMTDLSRSDTMYIRQFSGDGEVFKVLRDGTYYRGVPTEYVVSTAAGDLIPGFVKAIKVPGAGAGVVTYYLDYKGVVYGYIDDKWVVEDIAFYTDYALTQRVVELVDFNDGDHIWSAEFTKVETFMEFYTMTAKYKVESTAPNVLKDLDGNEVNDVILYNDINRIYQPSDLFADGSMYLYTKDPAKTYYTKIENGVKTLYYMEQYSSRYEPIETNYNYYNGSFYTGNQFKDIFGNIWVKDAETDEFKISSVTVYEFNPERTSETPIVIKFDDNEDIVSGVYPAQYYFIDQNGNHVVGNHLVNNKVKELYIGGVKYDVVYIEKADYIKELKDEGGITQYYMKKNGTILDASKKVVDVKAYYDEDGIEEYKGDYTMTMVSSRNNAMTEFRQDGVSYYKDTYGNIYEDWLGTPTQLPNNRGYVWTFLLKESIDITIQIKPISYNINFIINGVKVNANDLNNVSTIATINYTDPSHDFYGENIPQYTIVAFDGPSGDRDIVWYTDPQYNEEYDVHNRAAVLSPSEFIVDLTMPFIAVENNTLNSWHFWGSAAEADTYQPKESVTITPNKISPNWRGATANDYFYIIEAGWASSELTGDYTVVFASNNGTFTNGNLRCGNNGVEIAVPALDDTDGLRGWKLWNGDYVTITAGKYTIDETKAEQFGSKKYILLVADWGEDLTKSNNVVYASEYGNVPAMESVRKYQFMADQNISLYAHLGTYVLYLHDFNDNHDKTIKYELTVDENNQITIPTDHYDYGDYVFVGWGIVKSGETKRTYTYTPGESIYASKIADKLDLYPFYVSDGREVKFYDGNRSNLKISLDAVLSEKQNVPDTTVMEVKYSDEPIDAGNPGEDVPPSSASGIHVGDYRVYYKVVIKTPLGYEVPIDSYGNTKTEYELIGMSTLKILPVDAYVIAPSLYERYDGTEKKVNEREIEVVGLIDTDYTVTLHDADGNGDIKRTNEGVTVTHVDIVWKGFVALVDSEYVTMTNYTVVTIDAEGNILNTETNMTADSGIDVSAGYRLWGIGDVLEDPYKPRAEDAGTNGFIILTATGYNFTGYTVLKIAADGTGTSTHDKTVSRDTGTWKVWGTGSEINTYTVNENDIQGYMYDPAHSDNTKKNWQVDYNIRYIDGAILIYPEDSSKNEHAGHI